MAPVQLFDPALKNQVSRPPPVPLATLTAVTATCPPPAAALFVSVTVPVPVTCPVGSVMVSVLGVTDTVGTLATPCLQLHQLVR